MTGIPDKLLNELLMKITQDMPMRQLRSEGREYLQRYYVSTAPDGIQTWLHRYALPDTNEDFHSHPWYANSTIVCGAYIEESMQSIGKTHVQRFTIGNTNIINPDTVHKITQVDEFTWSLMRVKPNWGEWCFISVKGRRFNMGKTHNEQWWKGCPSRGN